MQPVFFCDSLPNKFLELTACFCQELISCLWALDNHVHFAVNGGVLFARVKRRDGQEESNKTAYSSHPHHDPLAGRNVWTIEIQRQLGSNTIVKDGIVLFDKLKHL